MGSVDITAVRPWFATSTLTAPSMRWALAAVLGKSPTSAVQPEAGVIPGGGAAQPAFVPSSNGSSSAPSVSVAPGQCVVVSALGHPYICTLPAAATVLLDTPLPASGLTRIDVLCARVVDTEADGGGTDNRLRLQTVTGTAAASPAVPAIPAGYLPLFRMIVSNAGAITNIISVRSWTRGPGGVRFVEPGDTRAGSHAGDLRIFATGQIDAWIAGQWLTVVSPAAWTEENIDWTYQGSTDGGTGASGTVNFGSGGSSKVRWKRAGNDLQATWTATYGTGYNTGSGSLRTKLPGGLTSVARRHILPAHLYVDDALSGTRTDWLGFAYVPPSSQQVWPYFPLSNTECRMFTHLVAVTPGVTGQSRPTIIGGYAAGGVLAIGPGTVEVAS